MISNSESYDLFLMLIDSAIKGAISLLLAWIATLFMWRSSAAARHLVWLSSICVAMLLPIASVLLPPYRLAVLPLHRTAELNHPIFMPLPQEMSWAYAGVNHSLRNPDDGWEAASPGVRMLPLVRKVARQTVISSPDPIVSAAAAPLKNEWNVPSILLGLWLSGSGILVAWSFIGLFAARQLLNRLTLLEQGPVRRAADAAQKNLAIRRPVFVRMGNVVTMPLASGLVRPCILLPESAKKWPADQLRSVLLHEMAHVKRCDCATQWLAQAVVAMYWFNPLAWLASARMRAERERACDDLVLLHGAGATIYAEHLMEIARAVGGVGSFLPIAAVAMARPTGLRRRVTNILDEGICRRAITWRLLIGAGAVAAVVLVPLSSVKLSKRTTAAAATTAPTASTSPAPPATKFSKLLQLTVIDQPTGQPISHAAIEFDGEPENGHVNTDDQGRASIDLSSSRGKWFTVQAPEHVEKMVSWNRQEGLNLQPPATYILKLETATTIGGKVLDDDGQPIEGANVVVEVRNDTPRNGIEDNWVAFRSIKTKADGSWVFDGVPFHYKSIDIGVWDYRYVNNEGGDGFYPIDAYPVVADLLSHHATVRLTKGVKLNGTILGPDGKPVGGAHVGFGGDRVASNVIPSITTKEDGKFTFVFKPGTPVVLTATAQGNAPELVKLTVTGGQNDVTIKMLAAHELEGHVLDSSGEPLANASVWLDTWRGCRTLGDTNLRTDKNGYFKWTQAPMDTVFADVDANGYMRSNQVPLTAGTVNEVKLTRPVQVNGTVTDAVTGKSIPAFKLFHGINWGDGRPTYFGTMEMQTLKDGMFNYTETYPRPGYAVRAEADGYLPAESRVFKGDEGSVHFDLKLQPAVGWKPMVVLPDGSPAAGAKAVLLLTGGNFSFNGNFDDPYDHENEHFVVAADGSLKLPANSGEAKIYIFSDAGFASADQEAMKQNATIHLQPWGHIHGKLMIGKTVGALQKVGVYSRATEGVSYDPQRPPLAMTLYMFTKTDADGAFALDHVPPGSIGVGRYVEHGVGQYYTGQYASIEKLDLQPGQTADVQLGGHGRNVTGMVELPAELALSTDLTITGSMRTHFVRPPTLDEVKSMSLEQRKKWYADFLKSEAGKAYQAAQAKAIAAMQDCPVEVKADRTFVVEDVPPGTYDLTFTLMNDTPMFGPGLASGGLKLEVPASADAQPMKVPAIKLQTIQQLKVSDAAPDFSARTLDGKELKLSDFRGKYVLLDFWATWCGPCVAETPNLQAVWQAAGKSDRFAMISLSLDEQAKDAADYVKKNNLDWNQVFLPGEWDAKTVKAYNVRSIPAIMLIGPDGKVVEKDLRGAGILAAVNKVIVK